MIRRSFAVGALAAGLGWPLAVPGSAWAGEATWVFLRDKGPASEDASALVAARAQISPRAMVRRIRARGDAGVDGRDLPIATPYLEAIQRTGARVRTHSRWLNAVSVEADASQLDALVGLPFVDHLQPVASREPIPETDVGAPPWTLPQGDARYGPSLAQVQRIGVAYLHACGYDGTGVVVGVQDSGFTTEHVALDGLQVMAERDFIEGDDDTADGTVETGQHNHGTMVLATISGTLDGTLIGAAPGAAVMLSKTEDISMEEPVEEDWFIQGMEWHEQQGADLMTASLTYLDWYETEDFDGRTTLAAQASTIALENGLILVNSLGNYGPNATTMGTPGDTDGVISVGALEFDGRVAGFSSRGPTADGRIKPDVAAPGVSVFTVNPETVDTFRRASGTSFSGPLTAGAVAVLLQIDPELTPAAMMDLLRSTADQADTPDNDRGWGQVNAYAAALALGASCECADLDGDGYTGSLCGGDDCDDADPNVYPGAPEICDGKDSACDGTLPDDEVDADGDRAPACADCDDQDKDRAPQFNELCEDGIDNNCDEWVDERDPACNGGGKPSPELPESNPTTTGGPPDPEQLGGCACAATGDTPGAWALIFGLPLALRRRRR